MYKHILLTRFFRLSNELKIVFSVRWRTNGINAACAEHDTYLTIFQEAVMSALQSRINESIEQKPEVNARNKAIQVSRRFFVSIGRPLPLILGEKLSSY